MMKLIKYFKKHHCQPCSAYKSGTCCMQKNVKDCFTFYDFIKDLRKQKLMKRIEKGS